MKTDWKWEPELNQVTGLDNGNCRIVIAKIFGDDADEVEEHGKLITDAQYLRNLLADMCYQFGISSIVGRNREGGVKRVLGTGGLSVLGEAFEILGWDDPHHYDSLV